MPPLRERVTKAIPRIAMLLREAAAGRAP